MAETSYSLVPQAPVMSCFSACRLQLRGHTLYSPRHAGQSGQCPVNLPAEAACMLVRSSQQVLHPLLCAKCCNNRPFRQPARPALCGSTAAAGSANQQSLSRQELSSRISRVVNIVRTADYLVPSEENFNIALLLWCALSPVAPSQGSRDVLACRRRSIAAIPEADRPQLLRELRPEDIEQLWKLAGKKYQADAQDLANTTGGHSLWQDMPSEPGEVVRYAGSAALRPALLGLERFHKDFFLHPADLELFGRVAVRPQPVARLLYPLYYKATVGTCANPVTREQSDMQLEYLEPSELGLTAADLPAGWPAPGAQRWPFAGGLVDYCRMVAPGVLVGAGWKGADPSAGDLGRRFLYFALVKEP